MPEVYLVAVPHKPSSVLSIILLQRTPGSCQHEILCVLRNFRLEAVLYCCGRLEGSGSTLPAMWREFL